MVKFILGTATFGTSYGVANKGIKLKRQTVREIIETAQSLGINDFDTAPAYGGAEILLGAFLTHNTVIRISSKISKKNATRSI